MSGTEGSDTKNQEVPSVLLGPDENGLRERSTTDEFLVRHRRLPYTMHFNRAKEFVMRNETMDLKHRLMEAMTLSAWYAKRDYPAELNGHPLSQTELAKLVGATTQRVSEALQALKAERCVTYESSRGPFFLIDDPELEKRTNGEPNSQTSGKSGQKGRKSSESDEISAALAYLESSDPHWFKHYQKVTDVWDRASRKRKKLREEAVERFRATQPKPETNETDEAETESGNSRNVRETEQSSDNPDVSENAPERSGKSEGASLYVLEAFRKLASYEDGTPEKAINDAVANSGIANLSLEGNRDRAIRAAAGRLSTLAPGKLERVLPLFEADLKQLAERRENRPKSWGIIVSAMEDAIAAVRRKPNSTPQAKPSDSASELRSEPFDEAISQQLRVDMEALLDDPSISEKEKANIRRGLGRPEPERKPADSEPGGKVQKAGQG